MFALRQAWVLAQGVCLQRLRSRMLHAFLAVGAVLLWLGSVGDHASTFAAGRIGLDAALATASVMGNVLACTLGLPLVSGPSHQDAEYAYLCRAIGRRTFLLGQALGVLMVLVVFIGVIGVSASAGVWLGGHAVPMAFAAACAALIVELSVTLSLACLFGSACSRPLAATCIAAVWLCGQLSDELRVQAVAREGTAMGACLLAAFYALPDYARLSLRDFSEVGAALALQQAAHVLAYGVSYAACAMTLASALYARRSSRL